MCTKVIPPLRRKRASVITAANTKGSIQVVVTRGSERAYPAIMELRVDGVEKPMARIEVSREPSTRTMREFAELHIPEGWAILVFG